MKKLFLAIMVWTIFLPPGSVLGAGMIKYSGVPCRWTSEGGGGSDIVGPQPDDQRAARQDIELQRRLVNCGILSKGKLGAACLVERGDGRLLWVDPLVIKEKP